MEWNHNCHTGSLPTTSSTYSPARSESNFGSTFRRCASRDIILLFCTYFPVAMSRYGTSLADGAKSDLADVANHVSTIVEAVRYFARWNEPRLLLCGWRIWMATQALNHGNRTDSRSEPMRHSEGKLTKAIEEQTAKIPSDVFLMAAGGAVLLSLSLKLSGKDHQSLFVGQWVAPLLIFGLYNKIVKVAGSDRT